MDAETYGWLAAIIAALSYGTYGVPIKETKIIPIHPFIFQTYKTCTMFICCWLVLLLPNITYSFSYWGILSGLLWVLGGTSGIIAVRYAGMAIAVGTWASVMICVNFIWGILIFNEPVANHTSTSFAFILLAIGLIGMSKYSETTKKTKNYNTTSDTTILKQTTSTYQEQQVLCRSNDYEYDEDEDEETNNEIKACRAVNHHTRLLAATLGSFQNLSNIGRCHGNNTVVVGVESDNLVISTSNNSTTYGSIDQIIPATNTESTNAATESAKDDINFELVDYDDEDEENVSSDIITYDNYSYSSDCHSNNENNNDYEIITLFNSNYLTWIVSHRTIGICGAIANGILTGTSFIPVHYAKSLGFGGAHYMISYAIGALVSNCIIWILIIFVRLIQCYQKLQRNQQQQHNNNDIATTTSISNETTSITLQQLFKKTYDTLPRTYFKQMCLPGFMAGLLLTIAMFGTLIAVTSLGQGVGNSVIQAKILISGMWGIFYYREINDRENIRKWFISASITVVGILWLSYERLEADKIANYYHHSHTSIAHIHKHIISNTTTNHI